ncbi:MAG: methyltransferase domain-containing protein [Nitrospirae bacterium]|nr:methyltransferase domain-containing protein [Nitrospirota bacterium]
MRETTLSSKYTGLLARFYDEDSRWHDYEAEAAWIRRECRHRMRAPRARLLDLCCGSGSHALVLARFGYRVTGIDLSPTMVRLAREKVPPRPRKEAPSFHRGSVLQIPKNLGPFDGAYLLGLSILVETIFDRVGVLARRVARVVAPGGFFLFDAHLGSSHPHTPPRGAATYRVDGIEGSLRISEVRRRADRTYHYDWALKRGRWALGLHAAERLKILRGSDLAAVVDGCLESGCWDHPRVLHPPQTKSGYRLVALVRKAAPICHGC